VRLYLRLRSHEQYSVTRKSAGGGHGADDNLPRGVVATEGVYGEAQRFVWKA